MKRLGELYRKVTDEELKRAPVDPWTCGVCGRTNTNWRINWQYVCKKSDVMWVQGECTACAEKRHIKKQQEEAQRQATEYQIARKNVSRALAIEYPLPSDLKTVELSDLTIAKGMEKAFEVMNTFEKGAEWIYLYGRGNTGKSMLMAATYKKLVRQGIPCLFINEGDFFARISAVWDHENSDSNYRIQKLFSRPEIVFWDDFALGFYAAEATREARKLEWLYFVFNTLSARKVKVVLSSNVSPATHGGKDFGWLNPRVGARVISRLMRNKIHVVAMTNEPFFSHSGKNS